VTGLGEYDDRAEQAAAYRARQTRDALARWEALIPFDLRDQGTLHPDVAEWAAQLAAGEYPGNLTLYGVIGAGKTWQAMHAITAAIGTGFTGTIQFIKPEAWKDAIGPPSDRAALQRMGRCGVLILDDLGEKRLGEYDLEKLYDIADPRCGWHRPIVITTNAEDVRGLLGERVASRMKKHGRLVHIPGGDRRRGEQ